MPHVKLFGGLRRHVPEPQLDVPGGTIAEVLDSLCNGNETLHAEIFEGDQLRSHMRVMVTGLDIELIDGLQTSVNQDDVIAIFPPIAGGSSLHFR
jgi:molybdopterin synthase sulfur carrier subunit